MAGSGNSKLLDVRNVSVTFRGGDGPPAKAVDNVSFSLDVGETLAIVGESGCGKSSTGRAILQLYHPTAGSVVFDGEELTTMKGEPLRKKRRRMQMIFQDPYASLNPRMTVGNIIGEPLEVHHIARGKEKRERVQELLRVVGLNPYFVNRYPHEFSGGQRQRIAIARAMVLKPRFVVLDEPTSALDMSVQAQIVDLLRDLQARHGLAYLFISHDLRVVRALADEILVMRAGRVVEEGPAEAVIQSPKDPYTRALMAAAFRLEAVEAGIIDT